jgi:hypothetical protein
LRYTNKINLLKEKGKKDAGKRERERRYVLNAKFI